MVLDDYQFITTHPIHETCAYLVERATPNLHLVIVSRVDPPLPLARLRAQGELLEIRADDLRFTLKETEAFFHSVMELDLSDDGIRALSERTEGWVAGLQMAGISLRGSADRAQFFRTFSGSHRYILDYLMQEVLDQQPDHVRDFLLKTSVLERMCGELCEYVAGESIEPAFRILEYLERANLFLVPLDDERIWFRYHHLFADLLQAKLYQSRPNQAAQLLSRAAEWCERDGQVAEAVSYALAAKDYGKAISLIVGYWQLMTNNGEIETVWSWLNALPEDTVKNSAALNDIFCWVLWLTGQSCAIEPHLVDAERAMSDLDVSERGDKKNAAFANLPAELAALRSYLAKYQDEFETARAHAERALSLIPENLPPQDNAQLHTVIFMPLALAYDGAGDLEKAAGAYTETIRWSRMNANITGVAGTNYRLVGALRMLGRLREADAACRDALEYLQAQGFDRRPAAGILHVSMSEVLLERNDLEAAEVHLAQAVELGKWSGRLNAAKNAAYALSRLKQVRHDFKGALAAVQLALDETPSSYLRGEALAIKARILVRQGSLNEAAQCIEEAVRLVGRDRGQIRETLDLAAARLLFAQRSSGEAAADVVAHLTRSLEAVEECGRFGAAIELRILRCLALARQGDIRAAEADLECALTLAESEGYVRVFLDEGQPMRELLAQWLLHTVDSPLRSYAIQLLSQFDPDDPCILSNAQEKGSPPGELIESEVRPVKDMLADPVVLIDPLTDRELEVLQLLAAGLSNKEIAEKLVVAIGTVKSHTSNIYRKLEVLGRTKALAKARAHHLI